MVDGGHEPCPETAEDSGVASTGPVQEARWRAVCVVAPVEQVTERVGAEIVAGSSLPGRTTMHVSGVPIRAGWVVNCVTPHRNFAAELALAGFGAQTQVHVSVSAESKPSEEDLERVVEWLRFVLAKQGWSTE